MTQTLWDKTTLLARIADIDKKVRHAGGSPDNIEIMAYAKALIGTERQKTAVVLGMTPELRALALDRFERVTSVDNNPESIALYRDWVKYPEREQIIQASWLSLNTILHTRPIAVLGDGIFGNLPDLNAHRQLLELLRDILADGGRLVTRMAMIPEGFDAVANSADKLIHKFRQNELTEEEFGFGMRLMGHHQHSYDPVTFQLNNDRIFAACQEDLQRGRLSSHEHGIILRYRSPGSNVILPQREWEKLLKETGFRFVAHQCVGKDWYRYYVIYECSA